MNLQVQLVIIFLVFNFLITYAIATIQGRNFFSLRHGSDIKLSEILACSLAALLEAELVMLLIR